MNQMPEDLHTALTRHARSVVLQSYWGGQKSLENPAERYPGCDFNWYVYLRSYSLTGSRSANLRRLRRAVAEGYLIEPRACDFQIADESVTRTYLAEAVAYWEAQGYVKGKRMMPPGTAQKPEHLNPPEMLPPVGCPLVIYIGGEYRTAERTAYLDDRSRDMTYKLLDGSLLIGRYPWTYP